MGWECPTRGRCGICCYCCLQWWYLDLCNPFVFKVVFEDLGQSLQALGRREEVKAWWKVFAFAISIHCLTELRKSEKICFVIFLPTGLYAVNIFFLSGCSNFTGERQLWSVDGINLKHWEIFDSSVCSCMLHVWNGWLCNSGNSYVSAKKQSRSRFYSVDVNLWIYHI